MKKIFLVVMALVLSNMALAHGEDKLGPNKGYIQMPGAFHTEVVPMGKSQIRVYLLDIDWKNPSVLNSEVKASVVSKTTEEVSCAVQENYFLCQFSKAVSLNKKAELQITATREGQVGAVAKYNLPLKLHKDSGTTPKQQEKMDHSGLVEQVVLTRKTGERAQSGIGFNAPLAQGVEVAGKCRQHH